MGFSPVRRAIPPAGVLALALLARLWQIDLTRFFNDQLELLQSASAWLDTGRLPLTSGFTFAITGARHPPLVTYLLALPMLVSRSPVWLSAWSAGLDALAAAVVYLIARKLTSSTLTGVCAGVLYALNPAALTFGRMIWNPDFAMLFAALALLGLVDFGVNRRSASLGLSAFALGWQVQAHVVNVVLVPVWLVVAVAGRKKLDVRPVLAGGLLSLIPLVPYLYLQAQTGWRDVAKLAGYSHLTKVVDAAVLSTAFQLAGPAAFGGLLPAAGTNPWVVVDTAVTTLLVILALVGVASVWWRRSWPRGIVALWCAAPMLAAVSHTSDPQFPSDGVALHYLLALLPALAVLQALGLESVWRLGRSTVVRSLGQAGSLLALGCALALCWLWFQRQVGTSVRHGTYGMPLRYSLTAAGQVRSLAARQPLYVAVPFLYNRTVPTLAGRDDYRWYPDQSVFVFPKAGGWYLAQNGTFGYRFLADHFGRPAAVVPNDAAVAEFGLFHLPDRAADRLFGGPSFVPLDAVAGGDVQMVGYTLDPLTAGKASRLSLLWRIVDPAKLPTYLNQFAHLLDQSGKPVADAPDLYDVNQPWQAGDLVASSFDLAVRPDTPTGGYWLELGFYDTFSQRRLTFSRGSVAMGSAIRVGPLKVGGQAPSAPASAPLATLGDGELALLDATWQGREVDIDWQALRKPRAGYTVFVHAVDASGKLVGQWDGVPRSGSYPTTLWDPGEVVHDRYQIGVGSRPNLHLEIGMYMQPDIKRLPVRIASRSALADHFTLATSDTASAP